MVGFFQHVTPIPPHHTKYISTYRRTSSPSRFPSPYFPSPPTLAIRPQVKTRKKNKANKTENTQTEKRNNGEGKEGTCDRGGGRGDHTNKTKEQNKINVNNK
jgi:hypothetical protein